MKQRQVVSMDELSAWLTTEVEKHADCEGSKVVVKTKLAQPNDDGCNWSADVDLRPGPNADVAYMHDIVRNAVREARELFNVE